MGRCRSTVEAGGEVGASIADGGVHGGVATASDAVGAGVGNSSDEAVTAEFDEEAPDLGGATSGILER